MARNAGFLINCARIAIFLSPFVVSQLDYDTYKEMKDQFGSGFGARAKGAILRISKVVDAKRSSLMCRETICPSNNIFIFYKCCETDDDQCCWYLRYWLTIAFGLLVLRVLYSFLIWLIKSVCC
ncbi:hypothetical protein AB6A40_000886 [Gnathostoma spinigerum]|uniref:Uncharacterized protein n=1 Tax=Gnathostoma spinigerum TaxID=75299 RepID=A0ABD6EBW3_9BILA